MNKLTNLRDGSKARGSVGVRGKIAATYKVDFVQTCVRLEFDWVACETRPRSGSRYQAGGSAILVEYGEMTLDFTLKTKQIDPECRLVAQKMNPSRTYASPTTPPMGSRVDHSGEGMRCTGLEYGHGSSRRDKREDEVSGFREGGQNRYFAALGYEALRIREHGGVREHASYKFSCTQTLMRISRRTTAIEEESLDTTPGKVKKQMFEYNPSSILPGFPGEDLDVISEASSGPNRLTKERGDPAACCADKLPDNRTGVTWVTKSQNRDWAKVAAWCVFDERLNCPRWTLDMLGMNR
ncbi:hypothetical protein B0H13DRAFT_1894314 [Mycena leptocephala]|nr:hypothetical protein B0H13DRAFT_1894314 [Mycena leptocephala]